MINVFIDTNIFRKDPKLNKMGFEVLSRLCKKHYVKLHIPLIVKNEFITGRVNEQMSRFDEVLNGIERIAKMEIGERNQQYLNSFKKRMVKIKSNYELSINKDFEKWLKNNHAHIYPVKAHHGTKVIDDYFSGSAPFKSVKNRQDFPDAFIFQTVLDILKKVDNLSIISEDKHFCESLKNERVFLFNSLEEFFKSASVKSSLFDSFGDKYFNRIVNALEQDREKLEVFVQNRIMDELKDMKFSFDTYIGPTNATVESSSLEDVVLLFKNSEYYGEGSLGIPFEFRGDIDYVYTVERELVDPLIKVNKKAKLPYSITHNDIEFSSNFRTKLCIGGTGYLSVQIPQIDISVTDNINIQEIVERAEYDIESINEINL